MSARVLAPLGLAIQNNSDLSQGLAAGSAVGRGAANRRLDRRRGGRAMPTFEDYRRMADRAAQLAIACSAPSVAGALLALAVEYMALADRLGQSAVAKEQQLQEMQQDPAGFGD